MKEADLKNQLLEHAHEVGGGPGGFFDFFEAAGARAGGVQILGEKIGVGGNDTKKIVQRMGDNLGFRGATGGAVGDVEGEFDRRDPSKRRLRLVL